MQRWFSGLFSLQLRGKEAASEILLKSISKISSKHEQFNNFIFRLIHRGGLDTVSSGFSGSSSAGTYFSHRGGIARRFFIRPRLRVIISKNGLEVKNQVYLLKLEIENRVGRFGFGGDAVNVKPYADFVGLGKCNLEWDFPPEWGTEWQFKGENPREILDQGLSPHRGSFDLEERAIVYKGASKSMLLLYTTEGENRARIVSMMNLPLFLEIPKKYKMQLIFRGLDSDGKLFSSEQRTYAIDLQSWDKIVIQESSS